MEGTKPCGGPSVSPQHPGSGPPLVTPCKCVSQVSPSDLQGPLIQGAVLALDSVAGASLQARVLGPCEDGAVLLQALWSRVLGTGEHLRMESGHLLRGREAPEPRVGRGERGFWVGGKLEMWLGSRGRALGNLRGTERWSE